MQSTVQEELAMNIKTILHPTDFSAASRYALELAMSLARDHDSRVVMLHVLEPRFYGDEPVLLTRTLEDLRAEAEYGLDTLPKPPRGIETEHVTAEGDAVAEILRVAAEEQADLIVLGTHGRTGLRRLLMGSVAENVIRRATCPVLAVKMPVRPPVSEAHGKEEERLTVTSK
jgi:nucleotide-binding universal stress UspA family protein